MLINEILSKTPGAVSEHGLPMSSMSRNMPDERKGSAAGAENVNADAADGDIGPPDSAVISEHKRMISDLVG